MLPALYNALWYPALPFALAASSGVDLQSWRERLAHAAISNPPLDSIRVWIHAASVGEIEAVQPVAARLTGEFPEIAFAVTTMTVAGREAVRRRLPSLFAVQLAPLDWAPAVRSFLGLVRPSLFIVAETELWPNYFIEARRAGVKTAIVNGRISPRSVRRYTRIRGLFGAALAHADLILAQTADDANRYRELGAERDKIVVTGNTKFNPGGALAPLRSELAGFAEGQPILIAGSTAPGEERAMLDAYRRLLVRFPNLALIVAPRHLERVPEVAALFKSAGIAFVPASQLAGDSQRINGGACPSVLLLDTMGELRALYHRATVAFVGGSLEPGRGGQNPAEPAAYGVPVMLGPHHENQSEPAQALLAAGGAKIVRDAAEIAWAAESWLADPEARRSAGENARAAIERLVGGIEATLNCLRPLLRKS
jgi:3-deoxy-D-manno-octulosonic-acid transferase